MRNSGNISSDSQTEDIQKILIVRLGAMGDVVHTLPAVTALREAFPAAKFGWIIEERWVELLCAASESRSGPLSSKRPLVDTVHTVNTFAWRSRWLSAKTWRSIGTIVRELRAEKYQVAVDFQGAIKSATIAYLSKAPVIYGFEDPREALARRFYTRLTKRSGTHIVEQNLSLVRAAGKHGLQIPAVQLPHDDFAQQKMQQWLCDHNISKFVLISPGAGWGAKQWPAARYGDVAKQISESGYKPVINFGPREETLAHEVVQASGNAAQTVSCSIAELIALTRCASAFIGGDTGPLHLAAALGIPIIAIFGPTDPARNGPFQAPSGVLRSSSSVTSYSHRAELDESLLEISAEQVVATTQKLLGRRD